MGLCLATPALALALSWPAFTLSWTHSVEKTEWRERWRADAGELVLDEARVRGSGAGMDPPDGSVLRDGWWVYHHALRVPALHLAVSGATVSGWRVCPGDPPDGCIELERRLAHGGVLPERIEIRPGGDCTPLAAAR